jgi:hypothetical protein
MMRIKLSFYQAYVLLLIAIASSSCEDKINVTVPKSQPLLVADAFITNLKEEQTVTITLSGDYFSQKPSLPIDGASVQLRDTNTDSLYTFLYKANGVYSFTPTTDSLTVGHLYKLSIAYKNELFEASSLLNPVATVDSIVQSFEKADINIKEGYYADFFGKDLAGRRDYYWIKSYANGVFNNRAQDLVTAIDGAFGNGADGIQFIPPIRESIVPTDKPLKVNDVLKVEIHSLTEEAETFLTQVRDQLQNGGLFAKTPENVITNFKRTTNGINTMIGFFNVAAVSRKEIIIHP